MPDIKIKGRIVNVQDIVYCNSFVIAIPNYRKDASRYRYPNSFQIETVFCQTNKIMRRNDVQGSLMRYNKKIEF